MRNKERGAATLELVFLTVAVAWFIHQVLFVIMRPVAISEHDWMRRSRATHQLVGHTVCLEKLQHDAHAHTVFRTGAICQGF